MEKNAELIKLRLILTAHMALSEYLFVHKETNPAAYKELFESFLEDAKREHNAQKVRKPGV